MSDYRGAEMQAQEIADRLAAATADLAAEHARRNIAEAALAAVPVGAIRRYFEHSDAYRDVRNGKYDADQGLLDCQSIAEWLGRRGEMQP